MGGGQVEKERYQIAWCQLTFNENAPEFGRGYFLSQYGIDAGNCWFK